MDVLAGSTDVTTYFVLRLAADGTEATGLTITNFDLQYVRSGVAPAAKVDATALAATDSAHGDNQAIEIDATDQPGLYRVDWPDAAFAAGVREVVLTVKCATCFTEHLRVNLTPVPANAVQVSSDSTAADTLELFAEALDQTTGQIDSGTFAAGAINAAAIADAAIDAATFAADVDAEILSYLVDDNTRIDASSLNTATVTTIPAIVADTNELQTDWVNGGRLDLLLDATLADTNELQGDWTNGGRLDLILDTIAAATAPSAATVASAVRTELATELARIDTTVSSRLASSAYSSPPSAATIADAVYDEALSGHSTAGTAGKALSDILTKANSLTFTVAGKVDANVEYVNAIQVDGSGTEGDPWGPSA